MRAGLSAAQLLFSGFIALAVAMGIGRFAFTPLLPMMQQDIGLTLAEGGWLASANYLGYFVGALTAGRTPWSSQALLRAGLGAVVFTTALMGVTDSWPGWLIWRFVAGVGSAWVLVSAASLCLARLVSMGQSARAGLIFAGVGVGIAAAGILCLGLDVAQVSSSASWLILGSVACLGALAAWPLWQLDAASTPRTAPAATLGTSRASRLPKREKQTRHWRLVASYGLFGFGYILPATFLPAQARLLVADPALFGLAWPLFGAAAALSTVLTSRFLATYSRRKVWAASQLLMAVGVLLPVLMPTLLSIAIAAVFVGGTFVVITMLAMQEAQAIAPQEAHRLMAAMTAAFAAGQLAGPLFFSFTHVYFGAPLGFALVLGAGGLVAGCYLMLRAEPAESSRQKKI